MIKSTIKETEIETKVGQRKALRMQERFLKGPIPMRHIARAAKLPGQALSVYLALHHQTALTRRQWVTVPRGLLTQLGVSRDAKARALQQLEAAVLVRVARAKGKAALVCIAEDTNAVKESNVLVQGGQRVIWQNTGWQITESGLSSRTHKYEISIAQLDEMRDPINRIAMWPLQMAEKSWVDIEGFTEAFQQALLVHKPDALDQLDLSTSFAMAHEIVKKRRTPFVSRRVSPAKYGKSDSSFG
jgi:hypothetical protein